MIICDSKLCTGCGACSSVCPKNAISMKPDKKGFLVPNINDDLCVNCGMCQKACHVNGFVFQDSDLKKSYAVCLKDNKMRKIASSGAVVTAFAKKIFEENGAVVGAIFDSNQHLHEEIAYSWEEYQSKSFSRSKYVQSETGDCFVKVGKFLSTNKPLLFVGTPCLNAALRTYLGKDYSNLITVDFVCHGVPSPGVFDSYLRHLEKKYNSKIKKVDFRVKKPSWALSSTRYEFENGKSYLGNMIDDPYNVLFVNNYSLRSSCDGCKYACNNRPSDITVCDYWGKRDVELTKDDERLGVSAVIIHSDKGEELFKSIEQDVIYKSISYKSVCDGNERLRDGKLQTQNVDLFWNAYYEGNQWETINSFCPSNIGGLSKKQRFLLLHGNSIPIRFLRLIIKKIKKIVR